MKMNNVQIRMKLTEKGKTYYWLAQQMGISDNTLFRRLREELPAEEQVRIIRIIDGDSDDQSMEDVAVFPELKEAKAKIKRLQSEVKWCRNELCLKCGSYHHAHEGACDDCRFRHGGEYAADLDE